MTLQEFIGFMGEAKAMTFIGKVVATMSFAEGDSIHIPMTLTDDHGRDGVKLTLDLNTTEDLPFIEASIAKHRLQQLNKPRRESNPFVGSQWSPEQLGKWSDDLHKQTNKQSFISKFLNLKEPK